MEISTVETHDTIHLTGFSHMLILAVTGETGQLMNKRPRS